MFCIFLTIFTNNFPEKHKLVRSYSGEKLCSLRGISWLFMLFWRIPTFNSRDMPQAVSRRSVTTQARVRCHASPLDVWGVQSGIGRDIFQSTSFFLCQYYSTIFRVNSTLIRRPNGWYLETFQQGNSFSDIGEHDVPWLRRLLADFSPWRLGFNHRPVYVKFLVDKTVIGTGVSLGKLILLRPYHSITYIVMLLLSEGRAG